MTKRFGMVIGLKADRVADYKRLHAADWPAVLDIMRRNGWRNFDIYMKEPENLLFGTFEYIGDDFEASGRAIAADPETQAWLKKPIPVRTPSPRANPVNGGPTWKTSFIWIKL